jgi:putative oligomerization/nucleic acid binding protein
MPGLLRGIARTAVIAGTATAVSNRVTRRQAGRWAQEEQVRAPEAEEETALRLNQLRELGELRSQGVLTEEEFNQQKQWILNQ